MHYGAQRRRYDPRRSVAFGRRLCVWQKSVAYIRAARRLAAFLGRAPDSASDEDLRRYQLHLVVQGISRISLNATITGLKFFFYSDNVVYG